MGIWLQPRTRLGTLCPVESLSLTDGCEVKFQRISAGVEEITVNTEERQEFVNTLPDFLNKIQLAGTAEQQMKLKALLLRYVDVFALDDEELAFTNRVQHEISLVDDVPNLSALSANPTNPV